MFIIHQSNRLEVLFNQLSEILACPLSDPMARETIVVQSQGMARWLSLNLASSHGISANLDFPFPAAYIWRLFTEEFNGTDFAPFETEALTLSIIDVLSHGLDDDSFELLQNYIKNDTAGVRQYQLSCKIAALFDQYMVHRPDWIKNWSNGVFNNGTSSERWQAKLWQKLLKKHGEAHRVYAADAFLSTLKGGGLKQCLPQERISLFSIPSLPKSQLDVFIELSQSVDIHLFLLNPCSAFWIDLLDNKSFVASEMDQAVQNKSDDLHYTKGCQLLVSLGQVGREFQTMLLEHTGFYGPEEFIDPGRTTVLEIVQSDILHGITQPVVEHEKIADNDASIQVHVGHSAMREVEILYDQLLDIFNLCHDIEADDVLVMVPDINLYAPYVEVVFGDSNDQAQIPFSITDQGQGGEIVRIFFELCSLLSSRCGLSQILDVLECEPIAECFGITVEQFAIIRSWLAESGIRWGLNLDHQRDFVEKADDAGAWQQGLDRILLGYVMPCNDQIFEDVLPVDLFEGSQGAIFAKLLNFYRTLSKFVSEAQQNKLFGQWRDFFTHLLDQFIGNKDKHHSQLQIIRSELDSLAVSALVAGSLEPVNIRVVVAALQKRLNKPYDRGFLSGRVTFCQMVPMRSIPFKVICMLGMDETFPRQERAIGFDLMKKAKRLGDRSRREDDRYLFLETILSARHILYMSYVGMSDRDHRFIPPSVLVSELLGYLSESLQMDPQQVQERFVTKHPLQPFSKRNFQGALFSYSKMYRQVSESLDNRQLYSGFFSDVEPASAGIQSDVRIEDFIRFFMHPVRSIMQHRYGIYLAERHQQEEDRECFSLNKLGMYQLVNEYTEHALKGDLSQRQLIFSQKNGELPSGTSASYYYDVAANKASMFADKIKEFIGSERDNPTIVELPFEQITLTGQLTNVRPAGQFFYRPTILGNINSRDLLKAWLSHLILNSTEHNARQKTVLICLDGYLFFHEVAKPAKLLGDLVALFCLGQSKPLPLFPRSSYVYADWMWSGRKNSSLKQALSQAEKIWRLGGYFDPPECEDPYLATAYGELDLMTGQAGKEFVEVAEKVLSKPFQCRSLEFYS